jgi:hypothetical protein
VLYWSREFSIGDRVYLSFMGADGGLYVVGLGIACCSATELSEKMGPLVADAHKRARGDGGQTAVVREQDIVLLWPQPGS